MKNLLVTGFSGLIGLERCTKFAANDGPGVLALLWRGVRIDPFDLCWECSSETLNTTRPGMTPVPLSWRDFYYRVREVLKLAARSICQPGAWSRPVKGKIFFLATTANHIHAVQPIIDRLGGRALRSDHSFHAWMDHRSALYALPFLPIFLIRCATATPYQRSTLRFHFVDYWRSYGQFLAACHALRECPSLVVLANDHRPLPRSLMLAAACLGIRTAFVPHAGVVEGLPPLEFDFAFLDGLHAARKYRSFGESRTILFLSGSCRLGNILKTPLPGRGRVLVCPALKENPATVLQLVSDLAKAMSPEVLTLRPHPRDPARSRYIEAVRIIGCRYSDAEAERAENALIDTDIVVCGDSNIILEARLARRSVVVFASQAASTDQYGYISGGLPNASARHAGDVLAFISANRIQPHTPAGLLSQHMATFGTAWEGLSAELIANTMVGFIDGSAVNESNWALVNELGAGAVYVPR